MSKRNYYTYTIEDLKKISNISSVPLAVSNIIKVDNPELLFHPDHINVLDVNFEIGQLVETPNRQIGIVIENLGKNYPVKYLSMKF